METDPWEIIGIGSFLANLWWGLLLQSFAHPLPSLYGFTDNGEVYLHLTSQDITLPQGSGEPTGQASGQDLRVEAFLEIFQVYTILRSVWEIASQHRNSWV